MKETKEEKLMWKCIKKMFQIVGAPFRDPEWYRKFSWNEKQEKKWRSYVSKELKKAFPYMRKKRIETEVVILNLMYGWKQNDYNETVWIEGDHV